MTLSSLTFPDFPRQLVRALLIGNAELDPGKADMIVDIAIHAVESGRRAMLEVLDRPDNFAISISALSLANSMLSHSLERLQDALHSWAQNAGAKTFSASVEMGG
ncbi:hypothetical protein [Alteraurantiacibacter palmitatis]|uniref:Uncharacterized protein n=1 Tax=Alteraurantiacibacter palmitatis TaxID=2054628 RepID=A0ABV7E655_9SPHN